MDHHEEARVAKLLRRQKRRHRLPALLRAWEEHGSSATSLAVDRQDELVSWLRTHWVPPRQTVADIGDYLRTIVAGEDFVIVMDFWDWDEAVALLAPAQGLLRLQDKFRQIYPDGFLVADQRLESALLVNFDDHADGAEVSVIGCGRS